MTPGWAAVVFVGLAIAASACATTGEPTLTRHLEEDEARVMFVGAHPDDETLAGPILARACIGLGRSCLLFIFNHGDGGRCPLELGCHPSLAAVRGRELRKVAEAYGAELEHHAFWNAPLPEASFPPRAEIARIWEQHADPSLLVARAIRRFKPTIILTFDPNHGFTAHPEHQLASRYASEGARRAASNEDLGAPPHHIESVYQVLNRYWITRMVGTADPTPATEEFDTHVSCGALRRACLDVSMAITELHRTQEKDMGLVRSLRPQMGTMYLRRTDPFTEPPIASE